MGTSHNIILHYNNAYYLFVQSLQLQYIKLVFLKTPNVTTWSVFQNQVTNINTLLYVIMVFNKQLCC